MKKRGFGAGKYNGFGGKLDKGETMASCAARELQVCSMATATEQLAYPSRSHDAEQQHYHPSMLDF